MKDGARVRVSRVISNKEEDFISLELCDEMSGLLITRVKFTPHEWGLISTGLSEVGSYEFPITANLAEKYRKRKITEYWVCEKTSLSKDIQRAHVKKEFTAHNDGSWELWDDGTRTQQPGNGHKYIVCKYVAESQTNENNPE